MMSKEAAIHLVFSMIFNQSCKSEVAFKAPSELLKRLNWQTYDLHVLEARGGDFLHDAIAEKPCLHRYHVNMAKYVYKSTLIINERYDSDPRNIWKEKNDSKILKELTTLSGVGHHKAVQCLLYLNILGEIDEVSSEHFDYMNIKCAGFLENIDNDLQGIRALM